MKRDELLELVDFYCKTYRHPNLKELTISGLYDLFPEIGNPDIYVESAWPSTYLLCGSSGVYIFLNNDLEVIYVGVAKSGFGNRLGKYFAYNENRKCRLKDDRITNPRYIVCIAVPSETFFEAASLELFLINEIKPINNTLGK